MKQTMIKRTTQFAWTAFAALALAPAGAALAGPLDAPKPTILGEKAPPPGVPTVYTTDDANSPFAFADFPDLPGFVPPKDPEKDRNEQGAPNFTPISDAITPFAGPKIPPDPESEEQIMPNFPEWADPMAPEGPKISSPDPFFAVPNKPSQSSTIPAPGPIGALMFAGGMLARRRR